MKPICKFLFAVLLAVAVLLSSVSCSFWRNGTDIDRDGNPLLGYNYEEYEPEELKALLSEMHILLNTKGEHDRVLGNYSMIMKGVYRLTSQYSAASLDYDKNFYSEDPIYEQRFMDMSALYEEITADLYAVYTAAYGTEYEDIFFSELSENEIDEILQAARGYDDEYLSLMAECDAVLSEFYDVEIVAGESDQQTAELYAETVRINNQIAKKFGYDNYFEYCYAEIYQRDYEPEQTEKMLTYSIEHLIPLLEQVNLLVTEQTAEMELYDYYYDCALTGAPKEELDAFFLTLGDKLNGVYKKFHEYELFVARSDAALSYEGAYTDYYDEYTLPVCYFGPFYQDRQTVVHELGHFMRAYLTNNSYQSYDAAELNSQGNEMLLLAYESEMRSKEFYSALARNKISDVLTTVLLSEWINAFEYAVYTAEKVDGEAVLSLFEQTCDLFGGEEYMEELLGYDVNEYWQYVVLTQAGYYVSYAISGICALELYAVAMEDYETAVETYETMVSDPAAGLFDILEVCEMQSDPFDEAWYEQLCAQLLSMDFLE